LLLFSNKIDFIYYKYTDMWFLHHDIIIIIIETVLIALSINRNQICYQW